MLFAVGVVVAVSVWWHANKDNEDKFPAHVKRVKTTAHNQAETEIRLTDLSKMRSLLSLSEQQAGDNLEH